MVSLGEEARESPKGLWLTNARAVRIGRLSRKALRIFASDDFCDGARGISRGFRGGCCARAPILVFNINTS
jgi:hypothetical protein